MSRPKSLPPAPSGPPSRALLEGASLGWLLQVGPLSALSSFEQEQVLRAARFVDLPRGTMLLRTGWPAEAVSLIVIGRVSVRGPGEPRASLRQSGWRRGPGTLLGERSVLLRCPAGADVEALTSLRTLQLAPAEFLRLCNEVPALDEYARSLMAVRERMAELLELLSENRLLHALGRQATELLLLSARLHRGPEVRCRADAIYVVLSGSVVAAQERGLRDGDGGVIHGPGSVIGLHDALQERAGPGRLLHLLEDGNSEVLEIPAGALRALLLREPRLLRHLTPGLDPVSIIGAAAPRALVVALSRAGSRLAEGALGYGLAGALAELGGAAGQTAVLDLGGAESARRLGRTPRPVRLGDLRANEIDLDLGHGSAVRVLWPERRGDTRALLEALLPHCEHVVLMDPAELLGDVLGRADAVLGVGQDAEDACEIPDELGQLRVSLFPLPGGPTADLCGLRHFVRVPQDPRTVARFQRGGDLPVLLSEEAPLGRACRRLARVVLGRSVGVALGGGGAWGFAHVALLQALSARGVAVDYIAGVSFGALVAAAHAHGGLATLAELLSQRRKLVLHFAKSGVRADAVTRFVDELCRGALLQETEIPFFGVATELRTGRDAILSTGTLGEAVRASGAMPPTFSPVTVPRPEDPAGASVLVDGGFSNNVPASVLWNAGADFVIAANIIPRHSERMGAPQAGWPSLPLIGRVGEMIQGLLLLIWQNGIDRARSADFTFDLGLPAFTFYDFLRADEILAAARPLVEARMPAMLHAYHTACGLDRAQKRRPTAPTDRRSYDPLH